MNVNNYYRCKRLAAVAQKEELDCSATMRPHGLVVDIIAPLLANKDQQWGADGGSRLDRDRQQWCR